MLLVPDRTLLAADDLEEVLRRILREFTVLQLQHDVFRFGAGRCEPRRQHRDCLLVDGPVPAHILGGIEPHSILRTALQKQFLATKHRCGDVGEDLVCEQRDRKRQGCQSDVVFDPVQCADQ